LGRSKSQLTNSYFSEGLKPPTSKCKLLAVFFVFTANLILVIIKFHPVPPPFTTHIYLRGHLISLICSFRSLPDLL
jgi:hypothetical protein